MRRAFVAAALLLAAGCHNAEPAPGDVTAAEARGLNDAAAQMDNADADAVPANEDETQ